MQKFIDKNYILENLDQVIDEKDKIIIFYSGIWSFINYLDFEKEKIAINLLNIIEDFVGNKRTIIFPSFTANSFVKNRKFDLDLSLPKESGIIPTEALISKNYIRTKQPLHSYLARGSKANEFNNLSLNTSWGKGSVLEWLSINNARVCTIGIPWRYGCSYFHRFEELYEVPWRYFKKFEGKLFRNKIFLNNVAENKYSSPLGIDFLYDYSPVEELMKKNSIIKKGTNKLFSIQSALISDIDLICKSFFENNPWKIVKEVEKVKNWIKEEKHKEILNLNKFD